MRTPTKKRIVILLFVAMGLIVAAGGLGLWVGNFSNADIIREYDRIHVGMTVNEATAAMDSLGLMKAHSKMNFPTYTVGYLRESTWWTDGMAIHLFFAKDDHILKKKERTPVRSKVKAWFFDFFKLN